MSGDEHDEHDEQVGTVAEEAAKLLGALSDWAKDQGADLGHTVAGFADHAARTARDVDQHLATGAAECRWCPVCRTVHALRQTSPEVRAQLTSAAASLLQAASAMLATTVPGQAGQQGHRSGVEHIDLDDGPADWPDDTNENSEEGDR
ncbi:hypothetical protein GON03_19795 [Nocardioides sp. MAH-18]|uniref:Uncharacterized protein n=1 Tax=Nocardioides agri TaxID=2682843 RepID=A0A6L6XW68_9ACTN|nr:MULTISPECIES: hypothetical protein [unclassified Nocardioides]MBA2952267.1 hypothetical protein [Nocardioides sp. CGMCC 1.13656]MVQ51429.1 hypothetical protein [Nocardioides sp. MAH-18]